MIMGFGKSWSFAGQSSYIAVLRFPSLGNLVFALKILGLIG